MQIGIIGGGPAGLFAAETAVSGGAFVTVFEKKSSVGRKLLVAGRGGLNLTKNEPAGRFAERYLGSKLPAELWTEMIASFGPTEIRKWAHGLGVETFAAGTGRVYPVEMKAAPLLRRWVHRLRASGVHFEMHRTLSAISSPLEQIDLQFHETGGAVCTFDAVICALGGGSWPETGSDGGWTEVFAGAGIEIAPLEPANCGWEVEWPEAVLAVAEGKPLKNIALKAGSERCRGELLVTRYGLEGGAIYQAGAALRAMEQPSVTIDFKPDLTEDRLVAKLQGNARDLLGSAQSAWRLNDAALSILRAFVSTEAMDARSLAASVKHCRLPLRGPRPIAEAISSAGGVSWSELDDQLMVRRMPGLYVAGEMIDWEAPTGGYLIQGAFATGRQAALGALRRGGLAV